MRGLLCVAATVLLLLVGCSTSVERPSTTGSPVVPSISPTEEMRQWRLQIQPALDQMEKARVWARGALQSLDFADARAACREFEIGVDNLQHQLPSPHSHVTTAITGAVDNYRAFARGCQGLHPGMSEEEVSELGSIREKADEQLQAALDLIDKLSHA